MITANRGILSLLGVFAVIVATLVTMHVGSTVRNDSVTSIAQHPTNRPSRELLAQDGLFSFLFVTVCRENDDGSTETDSVNFLTFLFQWLMRDSFQKGECSDDDVVVRGNNFQFSQDPNDPALLEATFTDDNSNISFYGTKDLVSGEIESVDRFYVEEESGTVVIAEISSENRLSKITNTADGFEMSFLWLTETQVVVRASLDDKAYTVEVDTSENATQRRSLGDVGTLSSTTGKTSLAAKVMSSGRRKLQRLQRVILKLTKCGFPYQEASVRLFYDVQGGGESESGSVWGTPLSDGTGYGFFVPTQIEDDLQIVKDGCEQVVPAIDLVCDDLQVGGAMGSPLIRAAVCVSLAAAIDLALGGPTGEGIAIAAACERGLNAANKACAVIDPSYPTPNLPGGGNAPAFEDLDMVKEICDSLEIDQPFEAVTWDLSARLIFPLFPVGNFLEQLAEVSGATIPAEFTDFDLGTVEIEEEPTATIERFITDPFNPTPEQGYVSTATVRCVDSTQGQSVRLSIVGTDGYANSILCAPESTEESKCNLSVPGAEAGIKDVLTAVILPSGVSAENSIIF